MSSSPSIEGHNFKICIQTFFENYPDFWLLMNLFPYLIVFLFIRGDDLIFSTAGFPFSSQDLFCSCLTSVSLSSSTGRYLEPFSSSRSTCFCRHFFQHLRHQRQIIAKTMKTRTDEIDTITVNVTDLSIPENT